MKKTALTLALTVIIVAGLCQSKDEKAVADAVEIMRKAMVDADGKALESLAATDLSYGHSSGQVEDKAAFVENIVNGNSDFVSITLTDQTIKIVDNTAIVRHKFAAETNNGGRTGKISLAILLIWQKQKGDWKLLARQAARLPQ